MWSLRHADAKPHRIAQLPPCGIRKHFDLACIGEAAAKFSLHRQPLSPEQEEAAPKTFSWVKGEHEKLLETKPLSGLQTGPLTPQASMPPPQKPFFSGSSHEKGGNLNDTWLSRYTAPMTTISNQNKVYCPQFQRQYEWFYGYPLIPEPKVSKDISMSSMQNLPVDIQRESARSIPLQSLFKHRTQSSSHASTPPSLQHGFQRDVSQQESAVLKRERSAKHFPRGF